MGSGYFRIDYDFLRRVLSLPEDTVIVMVEDDPDEERVILRVRHPDIKGTIALLSPVMRSEAVYHTTMESWGEQLEQTDAKG